MPAHSSPPASSPRPASPGTVERILRLAREHLGMELAFQASFAGDRLVFDHVDGAARSFGVVAGASIAAEDSFCALLVADRLPSAVPDARTDGRVRTLPVLRDADIGAYLGVPIPGADGRLLGTLCCVSHDARPHLGEAEAGFLRDLAGLASDALEATARERAAAADAALAGMLAGAAVERPERREAANAHASLALDVARRLGLPSERLEALAGVARLHGAGVSANAAAEVEALRPVLALRRATDERWDGTGPEGLEAEAIPLEGRIVAACACALGPAGAPSPPDLEALAYDAGRALDPRVVRALLTVLARPAGSAVLAA